MLTSAVLKSQVLHPLVQDVDDCGLSDGEHNLKMHAYLGLVCSRMFDSRSLCVDCYSSTSMSTVPFRKHWPSGEARIAEEEKYN